MAKVDIFVFFKALEQFEKTTNSSDLVLHLETDEFFRPLGEFVRCILLNSPELLIIFKQHNTLIKLIDGFTRQGPTK